MAPVTGHVYTVDRKRGQQWYVKYRLPDGRQVQRKLGPAWAGPGRPPAGYFTRKMAEAELRGVLTDVARGTLHVNGTTTVTFADACAEYLRYLGHEKQRAPSTVADCRRTILGQLQPDFGKDTPLDRITTEQIDAYRERLLEEGRLARRTVQKRLVLLYSILKRAKRRKWIAANPAEDAERVTVARSGDFNVLQPAEVHALARVAQSEQDAAIFTVAAFTGLRLGELRGLRWQDVDFSKRMILVRSNYTAGTERAPKSGKIRSVPLIDQAARVLDGLSRRLHFTDATDLVFVNNVGGHVDDGRLRDRFYEVLKAAGLGHLRAKQDPFVFHDLRHTFGTLAVQAWPLHDVQGYMGHADIQTTMLYVHHVPKDTAAAELTRLVEHATAGETVSPTVSRTGDFGHNSAQLSATKSLL